MVSLTVAAQSLCLLGEFQRAVAVSTRAIQLGRELRHAFSLAIALCFDAVTHSFRGEEGIELWRASGSQIALTPFPSMLAESHLAAGERAAARAVLEEAHRAAQPTGVMHLWQSTVERLLARLLAAEDGAADPEIERRFGEAIEIARGFDARGLELAARLELARWRRGRPGERLARASLEDLCAGFPADDSVADLVAARALLAERASA